MAEGMLTVKGLGFRVEGQGELVSILLIPRSNMITPLVNPRINLLTKSF